MPNDAIYMKKKTICIAAMAGQSSWDTYWENALQRTNPNLGVHTERTIGGMVAAGISKRMNILAGLPYISTKNSAGNLQDQHGLQDLSIHLKYKLVDHAGFTVSGVLGGSIPASNYVAEFLPMSIGVHSKNLIGRAIFNYHTPGGLYSTLQGGYTMRSHIKIDKDAYQANDQVYYSNEVAIPDVADASIRIGMLKKTWQAELFYETNQCVSGDYIRRNDMPFPTNQMKMNAAGAYLKYQPSQLGGIVRFAKVLSGVNAGQSTMIMAGVLFQFSVGSHEMNHPIKMEKQ